MRLIYLFITASLLFCNSCSNDSQTENQKSKIINNNELDSTVNFELKFCRKLGELEDKDPNLHFFEITDITKDISGNIYIIDMGNSKIKKFDRDENLLMMFGNKGQGPGEFIAPMSIDIDDQGNIWIADQIGVIQKFSMDGDFISSFRIPVRISFYVHFLNNGLYAYRTRHMEGEARGFGELTPLIKIYNQENNKIVEFGKPEKYSNDLETFDGNHYYSDVDKDNNFYLSFASQNRIEKYSQDGMLLLKFDRKLNYDVLPPKMDGKNGMLIQRPTLVSAGIQVDSEDRIWVLTYTKQPSSSGVGSLDNIKKYKNELSNAENIQKLEVFDSLGNLIGEIPIVQNIKHFKIFGDNIYFICSDNFTILEYEIIKS